MRCGYFDADRCRSCTLLPLPYPEQIARKHQALTALLPDGELTWLDPVTSPQSRFRNKAKFVVGGTAAEAILGINTPGAPGNVTDLAACPLHELPIERAIPALRAFIAAADLTPYNLATRRGELKFVIVTANPAGDLMVRFVLRSSEALPRLRKHLPGLLTALPGIAVVSANLHPTHAAVLEGEEEIPLHGTALVMPTGGIDLRLRPQSFFQTNTAVATALYQRATAWLTETSPPTIWDLYCGVGGFALHATRALPGADVLGIETSAEAVAAATDTAAEAGLSRARFRAMDATGMSATDPREAPSAVVVNPPRRGIGSLAAWLEASSARTIIYSSCNATTLAKDLAAMPSWRVARAQLLDMFPNTDHFEVLTQLERR